MLFYYINIYIVINQEALPKEFSGSETVVLSVYDSYIKRCVELAHYSLAHMTLDFRPCLTHSALSKLTLGVLQSSVFVAKIKTLKTSTVLCFLLLQ